MNQSVCKHSVTDSYGTTSVEVFIDINRELLDHDCCIVREAVEKILSEVRKETARLDPQTAISIKKEEECIKALFGDNTIFVEKIPNEYNSDSLYPWFIVTTKLGHIKIGWRKRVISISWNETVLKEFNAEFLFPSEDVTKYNNTIHAWGYTKAQEYIDVLFKLYSRF